MVSKVIASDNFLPANYFHHGVCKSKVSAQYFKPMRTLVIVGGVGGNPSVKKNDLKIMSALKNMCRLNCVREQKSEYINVGVKKWLKKTVFRCKKVEAK